MEFGFCLVVMHICTPSKIAANTITTIFIFSSLSGLNRLLGTEEPISNELLEALENISVGMSGILLELLLFLMSFLKIKTYFR